jgi:DNA-binding NtrC family response regulator
MKPTVLIVEMERIAEDHLKSSLTSRGLTVAVPFDMTRALQSFRPRNPDILIISTEQDGLKKVEQVRQQLNGVPIILIVRDSSEERILTALRMGVNDYFRQPFAFEELAASIDRNLGNGSSGSTKRPEESLSDMPGVEAMIGDSQAMQEVKAKLLRIAATDSNVLLTGETGTGKELAAELIHENSPRRRKAFVCINSVAIPENLLDSELFGHERGAFTGAVVTKKGKFELADGGTVFLDEIGDMNPYAQAKILRTIETHEVDRLGGTNMIPLDVRIIAATNKDPERLVEEGRFRSDLYYRLNVARLHLPPLRERKEDIIDLLEQHVCELNQRFGLEVEGFTEQTMVSLLLYSWPGNVRELKNLLEATFINLPSNEISVTDLPQLFQDRLGETENLPECERDRLVAALFATKWNKSKAAEKLRCSRMTLYRKMAKYRITATQAA